MWWLVGGAVLVVIVASTVALRVVVLRRDRRTEPTIDPRAGDVISATTAVHDTTATDTPPPDARPDVAVPDAAEPDAAEEVAQQQEVLTPPAAPNVRDRLATARASLGSFLGGIFTGRIDNSTWDELETALIRADIGVSTSTEVIEAVKAAAQDDDITDPARIRELLKVELVARLVGHDRSLCVDPLAAGGDPGPAVWLFVGVNGVGKTTTIGKLAARESAGGRSLVLAAADTFRAAAVEQLAMWAQRCNADMVRGSEGADPSSVVFDAVERAHARGADLVMADTAGRLQTKTNLMEELRKVRRVAEKGAGTVTETLLVLDATTGQNGLSQARRFAEAVDVTGVVLTKLDGSAKGGIVVAVHSELGVPVKLVGLGEGLGDLVEFDEHEFVDALFE